MDGERTIYTSGYCYVDKKTFQEGDVLKKPDSSEAYTIERTDELQGVYGMNKGYAVFRQINILRPRMKNTVLFPRERLMGFRPLTILFWKGKA